MNMSMVYRVVRILRIQFLRLPSMFELEGDTSFCTGDSVEWSIVGQGFDSISWNMGVVIDQQDLFIDSSGTTPVRIYSDVTQECFVDTSVPSLEIPKPVVSLRDTLVCLGESVTLDADNDLNTVVWNTGALTQKLKLMLQGIIRFWLLLLKIV